MNSKSRKTLEYCAAPDPRLLLKPLKGPNRGRPQAPPPPQSEALVAGHRSTPERDIATSGEAGLAQCSASLARRVGLSLGIGFDLTLDELGLHTDDEDEIIDGISGLEFIEPGTTQHASEAVLASSPVCSAHRLGCLTLAGLDDVPGVATSPVLGKEEYIGRHAAPPGVLRSP